MNEFELGAEATADGHAEWLDELNDAYYAELSDESDEAEAQVGGPDWVPQSLPL